VRSACTPAVLVNASASRPRSVGPLLTFLRWTQCAPRLFPAARFIGKFDDDVWVNMPAMSSVLRMVIRVIDNRTNESEARTSAFRDGSSLGGRHGDALPPPPPRAEAEAIVGRLESYHWYSGVGADGKPDGNEGPTGWGSHAKYGACKRYPERGFSGVLAGRNLSYHGTVVGGFTFPKGQAFYLTRGLARVIASSAMLQAHARQLEQTDGTRCFMTGAAWSKTVEHAKEIERHRRRSAYAAQRGLAPKNATVRLQSSSDIARCEGKRPVQPPWEDVWLGLVAALLPLASTGDGLSPDSSPADEGPSLGAGDDGSSSTGGGGVNGSLIHDSALNDRLGAPITFVSFRDPQVIDAHGLYASESTISWHCRMRESRANYSTRQLTPSSRRLLSLVPTPHKPP